MSRELLFRLTRKDFRINTFRAGGRGGQHQNKVSSAVRIVHTELGAVGESREERSQHQNRRIAFRRLVVSPRFQAWLKLQAARCLQRDWDIETEIDRLMLPEHLVVEVQQDGKWQPWKEEIEQ